MDPSKKEQPDSSRNGPVDGVGAIEQALYASGENGGYRFLARSTGFREDWLAEIERLCTTFGQRPAGRPCPSCFFLLPLGKDHVTLVQVADLGRDDAGRPGSLGFYILVLTRSDYCAHEGDLFLLLENAPPAWHSRGEVPSLRWPTLTRQPRHIAELRKVLNGPESPTLLGSVQALVDGGRVVFDRPTADPELIRALWYLLPSTTRCELYPASFAFSSALPFHVAVFPSGEGIRLPHCVTEDQAGDYPEGRYELSLQRAVEAGDQDELDSLLARRSHAQMFRLALGLLATIMVCMVGVQVLIPSAPPRPASGSTSSKTETYPELPPEDQCPALPPAERSELARHLQQLGRQEGMALPAGSSEHELSAALQALDLHLGATAKERRLPALAELGPLQRQVRALLWKQQVPGYNIRGLNTIELIERLQQHLDQHRKSGEYRDGQGQ